MMNKRQEDLINAWLADISRDKQAVYREVIKFLSETGYHPRREKPSISFKHDEHNKQMAKIGFRRFPDKPFLALRFSACRDLPERFENIVGAYITKYPTRAAGCIEGGCGYCGGGSLSHVYTHTFGDGVTRFHCGAYAVEIPDISENDIPAIKKLITEEHAYLMQYEAGR
jgi:hypothetical protein